MNWKALIGELAELGYTQARIAQECRCGQMTISDLYTGKTADPKFATGQALQELLTRARKEAKRKSRSAVTRQPQHATAEEGFDPTSSIDPSCKG